MPDESGERGAPVWPDALTVPTGTLFVNQEFTRVFGYGLDRFLGKRMKNFVAPEHDAEARALFDRILAGEVLSGVEGVRRTLDGRTVPVSMSGAAYADHEGRSLGVIVNVRDVSRAGVSFAPSRNGLSLNRQV